jgi:hypothetical protein
MPDDDLELRPNDKSLLLFDGRLLYVFWNNKDANIIPAAGITNIEIGRRGMTISNRFGSDVVTSFDKDRRQEVEQFTAQVLAVAGAD